MIKAGLSTALKATKAAVRMPMGSSMPVSLPTVATTSLARPSILQAMNAMPTSHIRDFHTSQHNESALLLVAGVGVGAVALIANYALKAADAAAKSGEVPTAEKAGEAEADNTDKTSAGGEESVSKAEQTAEQASSKQQAGAGGDPKTEQEKAKSGGVWSSLFGGQAMAKRFYKGGFEDKMSRREAALILGVRESATPERIRDRHRKLLMTNHPDAGGSTFIASKVNEAKDMLIKGRH